VFINGRTSQILTGIIFITVAGGQTRYGDRDWDLCLESEPLQRRRKIVEGCSGGMNQNRITERGVQREISRLKIVW